MIIIYLVLILIEVGLIIIKMNLLILKIGIKWRFIILKKEKEERKE
jgi:hypothetical protein